MIRYLIFIILTIPILLNNFKNAESGKDKAFMIVNYLFVFWLFQYFLSAFLDYFNPIWKSGFENYTLNEINYVRLVYYRIFIICYMTLTVFIIGVTGGMLILKDKFRKQFLFSLPIIWIFTVVKLTILYVENFNQENVSHLKIFLGLLIVIGIILGLFFTLYKLKGMKEIFK